MTSWIKRCCIMLLLLLGFGAAQAQLRGHGGPVRALAISPDGSEAISGSFDTSAIRWSLTRNVAEQVMRFHDGAVNAVAWLKDGRIATAGADTHIAIWTPGRPEPDRVLDGHTAPIAALALSPDSATLASASWDHTVRLWPLAGGAPRVLEGHSQNVNGVAFSPDGEVIAAGADGKVYFLSPQGELRADVQASATPIIAVAISPDGKLVAAAGVRGSVAVIERKARKLGHTLVGPGLPVWSVAFFPDNHTLLTGGTDRTIRRWDAVSGEPIGAVVVGAPDDTLAAYAGDPGAQVFRACVACHTLSPDEGNKAGPSLAGIFGRRIATLPGYRFSEALKHMNIVWTPATVAKMFEVGPMVYTPGTKMPEQKIGSAADRKALVEFLAKATKK